MEFSVPIFLIVLGLGVLQLAVGVVFGRCLPLRRPGDALAAQRQFEAFRVVAGGVRQLVSTVADDVGRHRDRLRQVRRELEAPPSEDPGELSRFVLDRLANLTEINQDLQTRLDAAEQRLQQQTEQIESHIAEARTDPLTRLPNRRAFDDELVRRVAEFQRRSTSFCLLILDLDHFKQLNDRFGHLAGDHVLRRVGEVLRAATGQGDLAARVGGEEFAVVLPGYAAAEARQVAEAIRTSVAAEEFLFDDTRFQTSVSLGLTAVKTGDDPVLLVRRADEALYAAKRAGRNCGFLNDGQRCEPIAPESPSEIELHHICDDLRRRVSEVAEQR